MAQIAQMGHGDAIGSEDPDGVAAPERSAPVIMEGEYEVLAAFYDRVYYTYENCFKFYQFIDAADEADFNNAISNFRSKALYDTGVTAAYGDKLITLVTCAYHVEDGRFVVVARKK